MADVLVEAADRDEAGGPEHIDDGEGEERLPPKIHELVIAETRQGPAHQHEDEHEEEDLDEEGEGTDKGCKDRGETEKVEEGDLIATEKEGGHDG